MYVSMCVCVCVCVCVFVCVCVCVCVLLHIINSTNTCIIWLIFHIQGGHVFHGRVACDISVSLLRSIELNPEQHIELNPKACIPWASCV
jgi:hypothetical protein